MPLVCCFTGNRPQKLSCGFNEQHSDCLKIKKILFWEIEKAIQNGYIRFISGMALGIDQWAAEIVLSLKEHYSHITLEAVIPCSTQPLQWKNSAKVRYNKLLSACNEVTVLQDRYNRNCMMERNRYMVDKADLVLAVWNGEKGGTANTVQYAQKCGKEIIVITPPKNKKANTP